MKSKKQDETGCRGTVSWNGVRRKSVVWAVISVLVVSWLPAVPVVADSGSLPACSAPPSSGNWTIASCSISGDVTIPTGVTLKILSSSIELDLEAGSSLTNEGTIENHGTISIASPSSGQPAAVIYNSGTIHNCGHIESPGVLGNTNATNTAGGTINNSGHIAGIQPYGGTRNSVESCMATTMVPQTQRSQIAERTTAPSNTAGQVTTDDDCASLGLVPGHSHRTIMPGVVAMENTHDLYNLDPMNPGSSHYGHHIFDFDYSEQVESTYWAPSEIDVSPSNSVTNKGGTQNIYTAYDFTSSFSDSVTGTAGISKAFSFTGSSSYATASQKSGSSHQVSTYLIYQQAVWQLSCEPNTKLPLDSVFQTALLAGGSYQDFLQTYGTHYVTQALVGGAYYFFKSVSAAEHASLQQQGTSLGASASGSYDDFSGGGTATVTGGNTSTVESSHSDLQFTITFVGGTEFTTKSAWKGTVQGCAAPIKITLAPLSDLLTATQFPGQNQNDISTKQTALADAITTYYGGASLSALQNGLVPFQKYTKGIDTVLVPAVNSFSTLSSSSSINPQHLGSQGFAAGEIMFYLYQGGGSGSSAPPNSVVMNMGRVGTHNDVRSPFGMQLWPANSMSGSALAGSVPVVGYAPTLGGKLMGQIPYQGTGPDGNAVKRYLYFFVGDSQEPQTTISGSVPAGSMTLNQSPDYEVDHSFQAFTGSQVWPSAPSTQASVVVNPLALQGINWKYQSVPLNITWNDGSSLTSSLNGSRSYLPNFPVTSTASQIATATLDLKEAQDLVIYLSTAIKPEDTTLQVKYDGNDATSLGYSLGWQVFKFSGVEGSKTIAIYASSSVFTNVAIAGVALQSLQFSEYSNDN